MRTIAIALLLAACSSGKDRPHHRRDESTPSTSLVVLGLSCAAQPDHLLRYDCTVTTPVDEAVTLTWGPQDDPTEHQATSAGGTTHELVVWGVRPQVLHQVVATSSSGEAVLGITPEPLPTDWGTGWYVTGEGSADAILIEASCAPKPTLILLDRRNRVVGYQQFEENRINGYNWTRDGTYLALLNSGIIVEYDLLGDELTRISAIAGQFPGPAHHEAHRGLNGITWVFTARTEVVGADTYVMDVLYGLDPSGTPIAEWHVLDHLLQPLNPYVDDGPAYWGIPFPGAIDYTHGNGVWSDEAGDLYLSFRKIHTVFKIVGDPDAPNFGEVIWRLTGGAHADEPSDFTVTSSNGVTDVLDFDGQHTPWVAADGRMGLFDNRRSLGPASRAVFFELDPVNGVADIVEEYPMPGLCANQGSSYATATGNRLITCATGGVVTEYSPGASEPSWVVDPICNGLVPRAFPVELPIELP